MMSRNGLLGPDWTCSFLRRHHLMPLETNKLSRTMPTTLESLVQHCELMAAGYSGTSHGFAVAIN